jgi:hypothetical protein
MRIRAFVLCLGLLLLAVGPRWQPDVGIDPRAAVNAAFLVAMAVFLVSGLHQRLTRF